MNVVLFTWSPDKFVMSDRQWERRIQQTRDSGFLYDQWSTGNSTKLIQPGDVALLLRQTRERGIVAKGEVLSNAFEDVSWNIDPEAKTTDHYVEIKWTEVLPIDKRLTHETLERKLPQVNWVRYSSGTTVEPRYHDKLLQLWTDAVLKAGVPKRTSAHSPADPKDIEQQKGVCGLCGLDPKGMYNQNPESFLQMIRFENDQTTAAVCPSCATYRVQHPEINTRQELINTMSIFF